MSWLRRRTGTPEPSLRSAAGILAVLDACAQTFTFPVLDNGYVHLAATRLSLHRSDDDWAVVIEVFGFSPRVGLPDLHVCSFGSQLVERATAEDYVSQQAYENSLANNPHNESRFFRPIAEGDWIDIDNEQVAPSAQSLLLRGRPAALPGWKAYADHGIELEDPPGVFVYELCRYLAAVARDDVLAAEAQRRVNLDPRCQQLLQLEQWCHPDVVGGELPSQTETFAQLARVLETGDIAHYRPMSAPNTHWRNWPEGGSL
jgi:hypothetical protein